ncbi:sialidase family protein [Micromonosporaceae bacterium B7E4]
MRRVLVLFCAVAVVLGGVLAGPVAAAVGLARVSGPTPFGHCPADARLPPGAVEPQVAANPVDPDNIVALWTQDRFSGLVAGVSFDRGRTWQRVVVPGTSRCTGGPFGSVDEAWLSFGPTGVVHLTGKVFGTPEVPSGLITARSDDGGRTWSPPVLVAAQRDPAQGGFTSAPITADPRDPARLYAAGSTVTEPSAEGEPFRGPAFFTRSDDGGRSWHPARTTYDPGPGRLTTGHQLSVLPGGLLIDSFTRVDLTATPPRMRLDVIHSTDGGHTWSSPVAVAEMRTAGVHDPERPEDSVAGGSGMVADPAVDPLTGRIYLVWQDARFTARAADSIALSASDDGGRTWTTPAPVNATPSSIPTGNRQAFTTSVDVAADGTVAVAYSDFRNNTLGGALLTDRWLVTCQARCTTTAGYTSEARLTPQPFDMHDATMLADIGPPGYFLGDYAGLTHTGRNFITVFAHPCGADPAVVSSVRVSAT